MSSNGGAPIGGGLAVVMLQVLPRKRDNVPITEPVDGSVWPDGTDIASMSIPQLRALLEYLLQHGSDSLNRTSQALVTMHNLRIYDNVAPSSGGGIAYLSKFVHTQIYDADIRRNQAILYGGGVFSSATELATRV
jgi:hypothetical protein